MAICGFDPCLKLEPVSLGNGWPGAPAVHLERRKVGEKAADDPTIGPDGALFGRDVVCDAPEAELSSPACGR